MRDISLGEVAREKVETGENRTSEYKIVSIGAQKFPDSKIVEVCANNTFTHVAITPSAEFLATLKYESRNVL